MFKQPTSEKSLTKRAVCSSGDSGCLFFCFVYKREEKNDSKYLREF